MPEREACERRVYRLAALLTGNPLAATAVIGDVVDAQPDLRRLDSAHLDRLTVLRSREIAPGRLVDDRVPSPVAEMLAALPPQAREAWVLARVYRTPAREIARAMDCSRTAAQRHLDQADSVMAPHGESAATCLLDFSLGLEVPPFYVARRRRRRRCRLIMRIGLVLALLGGLAVVVWLLLPGR
jgi:hypothetical protein